MAKLLFISIIFGLLIIFNLDAQQIVLNNNYEHPGQINYITFSFDGKFLVTGGDDYTLIVWDLRSGKPIAVLNHYSAVNCVAFSPDSKYLVSCSKDSTIKLWDVQNWKSISTFPKDNSAVQSVAFSSDGKIIASGSYQTIKLWNTKTQKEIKTLSGHSAYITSLSFSSDGKYLVSGCEDSKIKLWDLKTKMEAQTFDYHTNWVKSVSFSPDSKFVASGSVDKSTRLWDITSRKKNIPLQKNSGIVNKVAFTPDGKYLVSAGTDKKIKIWDINAKKNIRTLNSIVGINCIQFSPNGKYLASANADGSVCIWNFLTGKKIATFIYIQTKPKEWIVYTPNGIYDGNNCEKYLQNNSQKSQNEYTTKDINFSPGLLAQIFDNSQLPLEKIPPSIILDSDSIFEVSRKDYTLSGRANDESGILSILVNNNKADFEDGNFQYPIVLNAGMNSFKILAYDRLGNMGIKNIIIDYKPSKRKDYAVIFYESDYTASNLPNLKGTKKNADSLARILENKYGFETSVFENYSASQIKYTLEKYNKKGYSENDQLLIYFTGHGQKGNADTTGYLLCGNNTRMSHKEFNSWSEISSCKHILMILDACYSGLSLSINMIGDSPPVYNPRTYDEYIKELFKFNPARKSLTSGEGKVSIPFDGLSEFTESLLNALKKNEGKLFKVLTYNELKTAIIGDYPKMETGKFSNKDEADGTFIFIKN